MEPNSNRIPVGLRLRQTLRGHDGVIYEIAWSPAGDVLLSASEDRTVRSWERQDRAGTSPGWNLRRKLPGHTRAVLKLCWSPPGDLLASASEDGTVKLWDAGTGELCQNLDGHSGWVGSLAWLPDGEIL